MAVSRASQTQASSSLCPRLLLEPVVVVVTNAGRQPACGIDTMQGQKGPQAANVRPAQVRRRAHGPPRSVPDGGRFRIRAMSSPIGDFRLKDTTRRLSMIRADSTGMASTVSRPMLF